MTPEELLEPRYKVVADYPNSLFEIADILSGQKHDDFTITYSDYPLIFKKLDWWEERKPDEWPAYAKHGINGKPKKIKEINSFWNVIDFEGGRTRKLNNGWLPSTQEEYDQYIKLHNEKTIIQHRKK